MNILVYVKISGSAAFNSPGNTCVDEPYDRPCGKNQVASFSKKSYAHLTPT